MPAASLYHPELPQPDAQRLFDRVTRHPGRRPGALVFLSDLTAELASERLSWSQVGIDYEAVTDRLCRRSLRIEEDDHRSSRKTIIEVRG